MPRRKPRSNYTPLGPIGPGVDKTAREAQQLQDALGAALFGTTKTVRLEPAVVTRVRHGLNTKPGYVGVTVIGAGTFMVSDVGRTYATLTLTAGAPRDVMLLFVI